METEIIFRGKKESVLHPNPLRLGFLHDYYLPDYIKSPQKRVNEIIFSRPLGEEAPSITIPSVDLIEVKAPDDKRLHSFGFMVEDKCIGGTSLIPLSDFEITLCYTEKLGALVHANKDLIEEVLNLTVEIR